MRYCDNCGGIAGVRRRVEDKLTEQTQELFFCSDSCERTKLARLGKRFKVVAQESPKRV